MFVERYRRCSEKVVVERNVVLCLVIALVPSEPTVQINIFLFTFLVHSTAPSCCSSTNDVTSQSHARANESSDGRTQSTAWHAGSLAV